MYREREREREQSRAEQRAQLVSVVVCSGRTERAGEQGRTMAIGTNRVGGVTERQGLSVERHCLSCNTTVQCPSGTRSNTSSVCALRTARLLRLHNKTTITKGDGRSASRRSWRTVRCRWCALHCRCIRRRTAEQGQQLQP
jgi:hypothetical protein